MSKSTLYFGGIPTDPEVRKLAERFGVPEPGLLSHASIETTIGQKRDSSRYHTIVHAWRSKLLREHNVGTAAEPGEGIRILTEPERVEESRRQLGLSARQVVRTHRWALMIDVSKLDDVALRKHDHVLRASAAAAGAMAGTVKELANALKAPAQLPRATKSGTDS